MELRERDHRVRMPGIGGESIPVGRFDPLFVAGGGLRCRVTFDRNDRMLKNTPPWPDP
jgi:hypothetical protein